jgi:hypothetical protein
MSVQQKRLSKKEKKVLHSAQEREKESHGREEALEVPIIDVARDGEDEASTQTTHQPKKHGDEKPVNKKRKRLDVDEDANAIAEETPKPKKQKREIRNTGAGEQTNLAETKAEKNNSSKYILFVGKYNSHAEPNTWLSIYRLTYSTQETLVIRLLKRRLSSTFPNAVSSYPRL